MLPWEDAGSWEGQQAEAETTPAPTPASRPRGRRKPRRTCVRRRCACAGRQPGNAGWFGRCRHACRRPGDRETGRQARRQDPAPRRRPGQGCQDGDGRHHGRRRRCGWRPGRRCRVGVERSDRRACAGRGQVRAQDRRASASSAQDGRVLGRLSPVAPGAGLATRRPARSVRRHAMLALEHGDEGADVVIAQVQRHRGHGGARRQHFQRPHQAGALPRAQRQACLRQEMPRQRARRHADPVGPLGQRAGVGGIVRQGQRQPLQSGFGGQQQRASRLRLVADLVADHFDHAPARRVPRFAVPGGHALHGRQQQGGRRQRARRRGQAGAGRRAQVDAVARVRPVRAQPMRPARRNPHRLRGRRDPLPVAGIDRDQAPARAQQLPARVAVHGGVAQLGIIASHGDGARTARGTRQGGSSRGAGGVGVGMNAALNDLNAAVYRRDAPIVAPVPQRAITAARRGKEPT